MSSYWSRFFGLIGISGTVVALDQWTKLLIRSNLQPGEFIEPIEALAPFLRIVHSTNTGAAFGILPSGGTLFSVVAIVVVAAILYYYPRVPESHVPLRIALALQLGGAIGNLADRLTQGPVTDFIAVGRLPVFNVADASISVGVALLLMTMWLEDDREQAETALVGAEDGEERPSQPDSERAIE